MFFVVYWILPHRRLPIKAVLPVAVITGLLWDVGRLLYILVLPHMDLQSVYGPFEVSVSLMIWAFLTGLLLLAGAQYSATRQALRLAHQADVEAAKKARESQP
jgi:membrane protein